MDYLDITKKYYDKILTENETLIQNRELFISYTISGQIGVILYWLSGCQESPKEVANSLLSNNLQDNKREQDRIKLNFVLLLFIYLLF